MSRIRGCDHSLSRKDIFKFIYCFMILFLASIVYILKYFYCYYHVVIKGVQ
jgi:hypothetical protein